MKKPIIALIVILIALPIAWYLISPAFIAIEVDEALPTAQPVFKDAMNTMSAEEKADFNQQVEAMKDSVMTMDDAMATGVSLLKQGNFKPRAHEVEGTAKIVEVDGKKILRFENFNTINGPDLRIYLSSDLGNSDIVELGKIKATKGNVNYEIPAGTDTDKYNKVLVWCKPFRVLFSYAELS